MSALFYTQIDDSPVGPLLLAGDSEALHVLAFGVGSRPREIDADWMPDTKGVLKDVRKELDRLLRRPAAGSSRPGWRSTARRSRTRSGSS